MLSAFTARSLVELKQRDKSKIESILAYGEKLIVGLNSGSLRIYRGIEAAQEHKVQHEDLSPGHRPQSQAGKPGELLREQEKFSKYKIEQLALVREADILLSLSNGHIHLHDLQDYKLQETLAKSKGAFTFAVTSDVSKDSTSGVSSIETRLAVAVKRKLLVWTWTDGELDTENKEQTLVTGIKSLTWATPTRLIVGLNANYVLVNIETATVTNIVGPGSIGGAPGQDGGRLGATGVAGMSYLGMSAPKPLATRLGEGQALLARDINTHFIDLDANSLGRRQIPWAAAPDTVGYSHPYLLALQSSRGNLELRNPRTLTTLQNISLPFANQLHFPHQNATPAHGGKGFLVASERAIWQMQPHNYDTQINQLVEREALDEAISLLDILQETWIKDKAGRMRDIKMQKAQMLFDQKKYRESIDLFTEVNAPPQRVISLFPPFIAGDGSASAVEKPEKSSPLTMSPRLGKAHKDDSLDYDTAQIAKMAQEASEHGSSEQSKKKGGGSEQRAPLEGNDLKVATEELRGFLVQSRTRMKRVLNPNGTLKREGFDDISSSDFRSLLVKNSFDQSADRESILETANLIDTTLFRAYMFVSPSFAGPLFRIDNFCDPDVVNEKLIEAGRYNDLVDFFYGKRLHRQALELLERFGNKESGEVAPQLAGPQRTVTYLQNLPSEQIELILDFAKWPLEKSSETGMQIFLADTENAETLPRDRVLKFLQSISSDLSTQYLEHITNELNDTTPSFHQTLAEIYVSRLKSRKFPSSTSGEAWEAKTLAFLRTSKNYTPYKILALLTSDDPSLYEARAIVLSNMGQHRQALDIYVFKLQSPQKAEDFCNSVYLASQSPGGRASPPSSRRSSMSGPDEDSQTSSIYTTLLSLYLSPPGGRTSKPNWPAALSLLASHGARMPASSTLDLMPDTLPIQELERYFTGQFRNQYSRASEARVVAGLRAAEGVRVEAQLRLGEEKDDGPNLGEGRDNGGVGKGRNRRVLVEEDSVCRVCFRRFGGSAVKVLPDNGVVHYGCAAR